MWYAENRYDMEHADEIVEDDDGWGPDDDPDPFQDTFATEAEARAFMAKWKIDEHRDTLGEWIGEWIVEHYSEKGHKAQQRRLA